MNCLVPYCDEPVDREGFCRRHGGMTAVRRGRSAGGLASAASSLARRRRIDPAGMLPGRCAGCGEAVFLFELTWRSQSGAPHRCAS